MQQYEQTNPFINNSQMNSLDTLRQSELQVFGSNNIQNQIWKKKHLPSPEVENKFQIKAKVKVTRNEKCVEKFTDSIYNINTFRQNENHSLLYIQKMNIKPTMNDIRKASKYQNEKKVSVDSEAGFESDMREFGITSKQQDLTSNMRDETEYGQMRNVYN